MKKGKKIRKSEKPKNKKMTGISKPSSKSNMVASKFCKVHSKSA